ncbi:MAG: ATP phosphoribosyltransferase regulatory subunit [Alphaproteobacteria bacterium]|nr:ATP phosphoribosyltransferase regulatory subunit [Alphaproteobacteria bacterium]QQS57003.1 MAG: ATP phosphoribosyltransferase regulatory subunit [Alphaproteobacteria bacterium]
MENKNSELALLPNGFEDLLPPNAEIEAQSISTLIGTFSAFGYQRIKPPLLEFESSLLGPGPGERLTEETFRLMDPITHRMLGLRSDITPQIARIARSRLVKEPRPLRLTYANDVLRTKGNQMRTVRQFCQVGCEIIGDGSVETDVEICVLALLGLKALNFGAVTLDLTIPGFVSALIPPKMKKEEIETLQKAVAQRDRGLLETLPATLVAPLVHVMELSAGSKEAGAFFTAIKPKMFSKDIRADLSRLQAVCEGVRQALGDLEVSGVTLTVDLLEQAGFEYQKHLGFMLFSPKVHGELGRGGSYDVSFGLDGQTETAKGFTLYMDTIRKACIGAAKKDIVFVQASVKWSEIRILQEKGWTVVRGAGDGKTPALCTHQYMNGQVVPVKS